MLGKKGDVPWIIAMLILAVVVMAVFGYWFLTVSGKTSGESQKIDCTGKKITYCQAWEALSNCGTEKPGLEPDWTGCPNTPPDKEECNNVGVDCSTT